MAVKHGKPAITVRALGTGNKEVAERPTRRVQKRTCPSGVNSFTGDSSVTTSSPRVRVNAEAALRGVPLRRTASWTCCVHVVPKRSRALWAHRMARAGDSDRSSVPSILRLGQAGGCFEVHLQNRKKQEACS